MLITLMVAWSGFACAQKPASQDDTQTQAAPQGFSPGPVDIKSLPKNLFLDQKNFFTTPFHMNEKQWDWALPAVLVGAAFIASDKTLEKHVPTNPTTVSRAGTASNAGVGVLAGAGAGLFLLGHLQNNDQKRETGLLSGEAAISAFLDTELFKYAAGRERPFTGSGTGRFFVSGDSFPSAHATVSFAIASVIAHEYPGILTQVLAYGVAGGVGAARWAGQK
ncbi:MAG TPA: phosphatase PAP2 family protein, partial [Candidatus Sulfotelmatobacter sp.]